MDADAEARKVKWLLRFGIGLLVSSIFAWSELTYAVFGKTTDGVVTKVEQIEVASRRGSREKLEVSYAFTDDHGLQRADSEIVSADWSGPQSGAIPITYRSGAEGKSRIAGTHWPVLAVWLVFFLPTAWVLGGWIKESAEYARDKKRRAATEKKPYRF